MLEPDDLLDINVKIHILRSITSIPYGAAARLLDPLLEADLSWPRVPRMHLAFDLST